MPDVPADTWQKLKEWPELILERLADAGVARITLNRPDKRNCWNRPLCHAFVESLDIIRADKELKVVITKGAGTVYSSGLDLTFLREVSNGPMLDWDQPNITIQIAEMLRAFPRIMIAQVHGYCLGGALGIMNCHDIVFAAEDAQLGMPEVLRGSFGQLVTATLLHSGLPVKKLSLIALGGKNVSGKEADALGIISQAVPAAELEAHTIAFARDLASPSSGAARAPQDHGADGPRPLALAGDPARPACRPAAAPGDGSARRRRRLSQVAEGRRQPQSTSGRTWSDQESRYQCRESGEQPLDF